jgi:hypothetical protein
LTVADNRAVRGVPRDRGAPADSHVAPQAFVEQIVDGQAQHSSVIAGLGGVAATCIEHRIVVDPCRGFVVGLFAGAVVYL